MEEEVIREGFLCPICFKDLKSPTNLSSHFEEFHDDDKDVLQQLRTVFGKAKRKILNHQPNEEITDGEFVQSNASGVVNISHGTPGSGGIDLALWEQQDLGAKESHTRMFRIRRKETIERCVVETNKLIIRLDKLIKSGIYASDSSLPGAVKTRKNVERSAVPWQNDNDVKFCPNCQRKFKMTFRRHHCRLCGKVICQDCLDFMNMNLACSVLKLDKHTASSYVKMNKDADTDIDNGLKVCSQCQEMLQRQNKLYEDKSANSTLIQLYDKMKIAMRDADMIQPKFLKMAESVNAGEKEYGLDATTETRYKLLKAYESVEALSKRIQHLGIGGDKEPGPKVIKLQRSIRSYASNYLADNMFTLPGLPSQDKYNAMTKQKEVERNRSKKEKLMLKTHDSNPSSRSSSPVPFINSSTVSRSEVTNVSSSSNASSHNKETPEDSSYSNNNAGFFRSSTSKFRSWTKEIRPVFQAVSVSKEKNSSWGPVQVSEVDDSSDPIMQQMKNIESYIKQARVDQRWDEVKMFESNLKELQFVYMEQRKTSQ